MNTIKNPKAKVTALKQAAFTLIELSIVLVIIGLIVGGILVGQDLIRAAEIRATVGQVEKYNSAVNTFRTKYNALPGDITATAASSFGMATRAGTQGRGDGNGLIEEGTDGGTKIGYETIMFWSDLSFANLLDGNMTGTDTNSVAATLVSSTFPTAKMARGNMFLAESVSGINYYVLGGINGAVTSGSASQTATVTPIEAYNMDIKLDDGLPNTGVVRARGAGSGNTDLHASGNNSATNGDCMVGTADATNTSNTYNRNVSAGGNIMACTVRFRFN